MKCSFKIVTVFLASCILAPGSLQAQDLFEDDKPVVAYKPRTKHYEYFPITKITPLGARLRIEVEMETSALQRWYPVDSKTTLPPPLKPGDTLFAYPVYQGKTVRCRELSLVVVSVSKPKAVYNEEPVVLTVTGNSCPPNTGDMLELFVDDFAEKGLLLPHLSNHKIVLLSSFKELIYGEQRVVWSIKDELDYTARLMQEMQEAATYYKVHYTTPVTAAGPYAGKTATDLLQAATAKDVVDFLNAVASYPRK